MTRPAEELYYTPTDPFELTNLAGDPNYADLQARLSGELDRRMQAQADPGARLDTREAHAAAKKGKHQF